jgi:hypothetical protein
MALLFVISPGLASDLFFVKRRSALSAEMATVLVSYAGTIVATVGALCSAKLTKETSQGLGFSFLCMAAAFVFNGLKSTVMTPLIWAFVALYAISGGFFLGTANQLPSKPHEEVPKTMHKSLMHLQAAIATFCAIGFLFLQDFVAVLFFSKGAAAITPELREVVLGFGGLMILSAACMCSVRLTKETSQGIGSGFLFATGCMAYVCMQPGIKPTAWFFTICDFITAAYFIFSAGSLISQPAGATAAATTKATPVATPAAPIGTPAKPVAAKKSKKDM